MSSTLAAYGIELNQFGFTQTLVPDLESTKWSIPVVYTVPAGSSPAQTAQIEMGGDNYPLTQGAQVVSGTGTDVELLVELGSCKAVTIEANPYREHDCPYPFITNFAAGGSGTFQIICTREPTNIEFDVDLVFTADGEDPPPSADVTFYVDGTEYQQVPVGESSFSPTGRIFAFAITNWQGNGQMKIAYTYAPQ